MYEEILTLHSFLRYLLLILLLASIIKSGEAWWKQKEYSSSDNQLALSTTVISHLQLLTGLILYFISPIVETARADISLSMKDTLLRFWLTEHPVMAVLSVILITTGRILSKKANESPKKHRYIFIFYLIAGILIWYLIPWPFKDDRIARPWF